MPLQARDPRRREADEQDPRDRRRRPDGHRPAGDQHAEALRGAAAARLHLSGQPRLLPVLARRRADRDERLVADRRPLRPHARPRDLASRSCCRPARSSASATAAARRSASPRPATSSSTSSWATRGRSGSSPRRRSSSSSARRPSSRRSSPTRSYEDAWRATGELARSGVGDARRRRPLRRVEGRSTCAATTRRTSRSRTGCKAVVAVAMYGNDDEVRASAPSGCCGSARRPAATYLGDEISQGDWASRHDRYATPQHGRTRDGQVALMSWHCEDAAILYSQLPDVREKWHADRGRPARALRHVRRLGHVRLHERRLQVVGRLPHRDRHRHLGDEVGRRELGRVGGREARDRPRRDRARRLDLGLPRLLPRGRGRPRPARAGRRLRGDEDRSSARSTRTTS